MACCHRGCGRWVALRCETGRSQRKRRHQPGACHGGVSNFRHSFVVWDTLALFRRNRPMGRGKRSLGRLQLLLGSLQRSMGSLQRSMGRLQLSVGRRAGSLGRRVGCQLVTPQRGPVVPQKPGEGSQRRQKVPYAGRTAPQRLRAPPSGLVAAVYGVRPAIHGGVASVGRGEVGSRFSRVGGARRSLALGPLQPVSFACSLKTALESRACGATLG